MDLYRVCGFVEGVWVCVGCVGLCRVCGFV